MKLNTDNKYLSMPKSGEVKDLTLLFSFFVKNTYI